MFESEHIKQLAIKNIIPHGAKLKQLKRKGKKDASFLMKSAKCIMQSFGSLRTDCILKTSPYYLKINEFYYKLLKFEWKLV